MPPLEDNQMFHEWAGTVFVALCLVAALAFMTVMVTETRHHKDHMRTARAICSQVTGAHYEGCVEREYHMLRAEERQRP
jgi:hypothetical protein